MSYPGPLSTNVNLGCDTGNQRATDVFNFQLNTGAASNESTLQSPAAVVPDSVGNVSLSLISGPATDTANLTITGGQGAAAVSGITINGGVAAVNVIGTNGSRLRLLGGGLQSIQFTDPTTTGIAVYQDTANPGQLSIGNDTTGTNIAEFNQTTNEVTLGKSGAAGTINLNATVSISDAAGGSNLLVLSPISASASQILQTPTGAGTLNIGSSLSNADVIAVRDTGAANTGSVLIGGNGGNNILMTGSINNAAATISTDRAPGNTGVLTLGGSVGAPGISLTDSGVSFLQDTQTAINTTLTIGGNINMGTDGTIRNYSNSQTTGNAALGSGQTATITSTNPPPNGEGLYCVTIYAPNDITANVSGVAYWTGSLWYGGSTGNAAYRVQVGPSFNLLQFFNTSGTTMNGVYQTNVFQILGRTTA